MTLFGQGSCESASSLAPEEKFSAGVIVWGGVSYRGLVPAAAPVFCDEFLPHETQAPKCADIWPIENVWAIIKQDLAQVSVTTIPEMKKQIIKVWQRLMLTKNCVTI